MHIDARTHMRARAHANFWKAPGKHAPAQLQPRTHLRAQRVHELGGEAVVVEVERRLRAREDRPRMHLRMPVRVVLCARVPV